MLNVLKTQRLEDYHVIDTVQELRTEGATQRLHNLLSGLLVEALCAGTSNELRTNVTGHDNDGVLEAHYPTLTVRQAAIVQHLQQDVEDVRMSLLHLVQQDDGVWMPTNCLGKLAALVIAHVSWRCANKTLDRELLHVLGHINADQRTLVVKQQLCQRLC